MDGKSLDITKDKLNQIKVILPEVFTEDKVDWEKLRLALGEDINILDERYVLNWAGKSDAFRALQTPTITTLAPARDESINFDETENIFIEGENLEVLKVLQKAYYGKIKMIYIDPPYNTGNDSFVYPDKFSESREEYLKRIQAKDEEGFLLKDGLLRSNSKDSGHYHSNWLSMMYPRLFLARNLLREDGVIFVSIDDNEVHNLRLLMNDVFGEENFIATFTWEGALKNDSKFVSVSHDYIVCFACNKEKLKINDKEWRTRKEGIDAIYSTVEKLIERYGDDFIVINEELKSWYSTLSKKLPAWQHKHYNRVDGRGVYFPGDVSWPGGGGPKYEVLHPVTGKPVKVPKRGWVYSKMETMQEAIKNDLIDFGDDETSVPKKKYYLHETEGQVLASVIYKDRRGAQQRLDKLLGGRVFNNPKDTKVLIRFIEAVTNKDDIILDFFAGSGTIAEAIYKINAIDDSTRRFVLVQYPEELDQNKKEQKVAFEFCVSNGFPPNISEIGKERIRRVIQKIKEKDPMFAKSNQDLGFKVFKLKHSNFKLWRADGITNSETLEKQLDMLADPVREEVIEENMLVELLLKSGYSLTTSIDKREVGQTHYYLANGELAIALHALDEVLVKDVLTQHPQQFICLDRLFVDNDQLKTNTHLQFKDAGITFHSI